MDAWTPTLRQIISRRRRGSIPPPVPPPPSTAAVTAWTPTLRQIISRRRRGAFTPTPVAATLTEAVRVHLLANHPTLCDGYLMETPTKLTANGKSLTTPYVIINEISEVPHWNLGGSTYPATYTLQFTFVHHDSETARSLRDAAYQLYTPRKNADRTAANVLPAFANGTLPPCGALPGRKFQWKQAMKAASGQPDWLYAFYCDFYVTRTM